jgi:rare lipoprotein A (peptidoglycan hydrolase)
MRITGKTAMRMLGMLAGMASMAMLAGSTAASALSGTGTTGGSSAPASGPSTGASVPVKTPPKIHTTGIATWFGPGFYGQKTACGQTLTPEVVGVANRTLPCGTLVKISYRGHALTVPVLDRGPYSHGAQWDLTAGAAVELDITETVRIGTRVVGATANIPSLGAPLLPSASTIAGGAAFG